MAILLGLAAALLYGGADFGGGLLSRRLGSLRVNVLGSTAAAALSLIALATVHTGTPSLRAIGWGLVSGIGGGIGTLMLYRGLARGQMSVVGPVSAVGAAVLPAIVGFAMGQRLELLPAIGVVLALPAIALVAGVGTAGPLRSGLGDGLAAGTAFGVLFVGLAQAGPHAGLWPIASEQVSSAAIVLGVAVGSRESLRVGLRNAGLPVVVGLGGMSATLLYFFATHSGTLATVAILTSLYPGVTVVLARLFLHERFSLVQRAGLGLAAVAVAAIALN
jgi:drug/metabolite transporter (DMT)-like permease